jgi:two-component system, OmpR family, sensor histidine kinase VicK
VFSRFFRGRQAMEGDVEGAGLGLYITKQLVELHGGEMWFRSKEGVGTTFSFTIPADRPQPDEATEIHEHPHDHV